MSMLSLALNEVHNGDIPVEILEEAFVIPFRTERFAPVSMDAMIIQEVIQKRVLPDLNIEYATRINIPLGQCIVTPVTTQDYIVEVPEELVNGRKIITVLGINFTQVIAGDTMYGNGTIVGNQSGMLVAAQKMANATSGMSPNYDVNVDMISGSTFRIRRAGYLNMSCQVELILENDPELNNIPITAAKYLKKLVVLAVKAYLYRKLRIRLNQAKLDGGSELTAFSEFVESYRDANEQYLEELRYAGSVQWQASEEMKYDFLRMLISNTV